MSLFSDDCLCVLNFHVNVLERYFHVMKLQSQNAIDQPENFISSQVGFNQTYSQLSTKKKKKKKELGVIVD